MAGNKRDDMAERDTAAKSEAGPMAGRPAKASAKSSAGSGRNSLKVLGFAALLAGLPFALTNDYYLSVLTLCGLNAIIALGLSLLLGYAGQISLGHAAFYGIAAYATAVATTTFAWPIPAGMVLGVTLSAVVAFLIGIPTLKLKGHYLAMATLGFGVIVSIVFNETVELTGGPSGFVGIPKLALFGYEFDTDLKYYGLVAGVLCVLLLLAFNLIGSRTGRALRALHSSERAAEAVGVDVMRHKLFAFVLSAVYAGVAGALYAHYLTFIAPASFGFHFSVQLITMVVLGGMSSAWGAVAGAFFLTMLPEFLRELESVDTLVYGAILTLCMMYLPGGMAGGLTSLGRLIRRAAGRTNASPSTEARNG